MAQATGKVCLSSLNGRRSRQTELANYRSGGSGTGKGPTLLLRACELYYSVAESGRIDRHLGNAGLNEAAGVLLGQPEPRR